MKKGKVKFYNEKKGYGFIELETGGDAFVHVSTLQKCGLDALYTDQKVTDIELGLARGKEAVVRLRAE